MKQILKAGEIIHFHGIPAELLTDIEVESSTDLRREDLLAQTDAAVEKAQKDLFQK